MPVFPRIPRRILNIHELPDWPAFRWDYAAVAAPLAAARHLQGRLIGRMEAVDPTPRQAAVLGTLTNDVVTSSDIEGEHLDADRVRSSVARRLGVNVGGRAADDPHVDGVVAMIIDATQRHD